jgi:ubiquitin-like protein Pup
MPYITQDRRDQLPDTFFEGLADEPVAGDLNYLFTLISQEYLRRRGLRYAYINDVVGALEGAKLEAYRRIAGDYEDIAIAKNGDVLDVPFPAKESTPLTGATDVQAAHKQKPKQEQESDSSTPAVPAAGAKSESSDTDKLKQDLDDLLDEIEGVLEENAQEFVANYIQKGGQ